MTKRIMRNLGATLAVTLVFGLPLFYVYAWRMALEA